MTGQVSGLLLQSFTQKGSVVFKVFFRVVVIFLRILHAILTTVLLMLWVLPENRTYSNMCCFSIKSQILNSVIRSKLLVIILQIEGIGNILSYSFYEYWVHETIGNLIFRE